MRGISFWRILSTALAVLACSAGLARAQLLSDTFTNDSALKTSLWAEQTSLLTNLETNFNSLMPPVLTFGPSGMQMAGVTNIYEFTGLQSVSNFAPPFTLTAVVNGEVASGCPFMILLVNSNLTQWLSVQGNVSVSNSGYYGLWVNYTGSGNSLGYRGESLFASPSTNVWYTFQFAVGSNGSASVSVSDAGGVEGTLNGLEAGLGPYYVVLAQKEGYPANPGTNIALWQLAKIVTASPPLTLSVGLAPVWSTNGMSLEMRGPSGTFVVESVFSLADPLLWQAVQLYSTTNSSFQYDFADAGATNYGRRFYRAFQWTAPNNMVLIPPGPSVMGDPFGTVAGELPLHTNQLGTYYIDQYEVTAMLWSNVTQWATNHGYAFSASPTGKTASEPEQSVTWYDCVKWCNARSEMESRVPAYYTDATWATVYRTGNLNLSNACVLWNAGYRLPTEAEWEAAARSGLAGDRFPWGNNINESEANYFSDGDYAYDQSDTGYNTTYNNGVQPYTSPVGSFAANGYGLYDMAGNAWQWCWDWYGSYSGNPQKNPQGPATGTMRVRRGGSWMADAYYSRSSCRGTNAPSVEGNDCGFRTVLGMGQ